MKQTLPFGCWQPAFALSEAFRQPTAPRYPQLLDHDLYWLTVSPEQLDRPGQADRTVLMRYRHGVEQCLLPAPYSIRSRVHEYGGRAHLLLPGRLIFVNQDDQRLYSLLFEEDLPPVPLTPAVAPDGSTVYFADPVQIGQTWFVAVAEYHRPSGRVDNLLVAIDFQRPEDQPRVLVSGADFYAGFASTINASVCAWIEWDQPYMQWDHSCLRTAQIGWRGDKPVFEKVRMLVNEPECSVYPPLVCTDGSLVFAMDRCLKSDGVGNFSNLYHFINESTEVLGPQCHDIGEPFWVFGQNRYCEAGSGRVLAIRTFEDHEALQLIDLKTGLLQELETEYVGFAQLLPADNAVLMTAVTDTASPQVIALQLDSLQCHRLLPGTVPMPPEQVSIPQALHFAVAESEIAHAWFYPPCNTSCRAPVNTLPPLLVMLHGGPTSRSRRGFSLEKQIWTSLGFAVLDINYRGSSGYGRHYRQRLLGGWGVVEIADVVAAIDDVMVRGWADSSKVFIRGGSAGGYTVLRALTEYPKDFSAGSCYYGIANLAILARITHKFEACYLDRLLGETFDEAAAENPKNVYWQRSPIRHMEQLCCPMIVFQGLEDKVVPPALSQELVAQLQRNGLEHQYMEYPEEGHGFRKVATRVDSLTREIAFFQHLLQCPNAAVGGGE